MSPATPKASIAAILAAYSVGYGDVILVDVGHHEIPSNISLTADISGVTIRGFHDSADPTRVAILDRGNTSEGSYVFDLVGADDVTLDQLSQTGARIAIHAGNQAGSERLTLTGSDLYGNAAGALELLRGNEGAIIAGNRFYETQSAVYINTWDVTFTGNEVFNNGGTGVRVDLWNSGTSTGPILIENNRVFGNLGHGISTNGNSFVGGSPVQVRGNEVFGHTGNYGIESVSTLVEANEVHSNRIGIYAPYGSDIQGNRVFNNSEVGIQTSGNTAVSSNSVYSNSIGIEGRNSPYGNFSGQMTNNLVYANSNYGIRVQNGTPRVINNTVYQPVGNALSLESGVQNARVYNNILWVDAGYGIYVSPDSQLGFQSDYNLFYPSPDPNGAAGYWDGQKRDDLAAWSAASGNDLHSIEADPLFVDRNGADNVLGYSLVGGGYDGGRDDNFYLSKNSQAIDRGSSLFGTTHDIEGFPRVDDPGTPNVDGITDIGAYEFRGNSLDETPPIIVGSTPPIVHAGGATALPPQAIHLTFSEEVNPIDAQSPSAYDLRSSGPDGIYGTDDDVIYPLQPQYAPGQNTVILVIANPNGLPGPVTLPIGEYRLTVLGTATSSIHDLAGNRFDGDEDGSPGGNYIRFFEIIEVGVAEVAGSFVYHRGSSFDVGDLANALDSSKFLAQEGSEPLTLSFDNLINSSRGINGLVFDIDGLPSTTLSTSDFVFQWSPQSAFNEAENSPYDWELAPLPSAITVFTGSPNRVVIEWPDNAIINRWLRVTILATANTGLAQPEVYYIGHLLGETTGALNGFYSVAFVDISLVRAAIGQTANASNLFDINKDGTITFADISAMRSNIGSQLTNITIPASGLRGTPQLESKRSKSTDPDSMVSSSLLSWTDIKEDERLKRQKALLEILLADDEP